MSELARIAEELGKTIENRTQQKEKTEKQILIMQGELRALAVVKKMMELGGGDTPAAESPAPNAEAAKAIEEFNNELERRREEGICAYKANRASGGQWCDKKLRGKTQKEAGYCKQHMEEVNG